MGFEVLCIFFFFSFFLVFAFILFWLVFVCVQLVNLRHAITFLNSQICCSDLTQ